MSDFEVNILGRKGVEERKREPEHDRNNIVSSRKRKEEEPDFGKERHRPQVSRMEVVRNEDMCMAW